MAQRVRYGTKNSLVEEEIREAIVRGEVLPGEWLRPDDWAGRLGVSQTPIREALQKLEAQGLVTVYPHRGAQVANFDLAAFVEVYQIRAVLEGLAARLAMTDSSDDEHEALLADLHESCGRIVAAAREGNFAELRQANRDMHMALYAAAKAPRLEQMIRNLWATFPWDTLSLVPGRSEQAAHEHQEMLAAARERDGGRLAALITAHVEQAAQALLAYAETVGVPLWEPQARRLLRSRHQAGESGSGAQAPDARIGS